ELLVEQLVADLRADVVVAERGVGAERVVEREAAEPRQLRLGLQHGLAAAVLDLDLDLLARRHARRPAGRDLSRDALEVHALAGPVQAAVALDEAADLRGAAAAVLGDAEVPALDPVRPVAVDDRGVARLLDDGDQALAAVAVPVLVLLLLGLGARGLL